MHPSRVPDLTKLDELRFHSAADFEGYNDSFGNNCCSFLPPGDKFGQAIQLIYDTGKPDTIAPWAREIPVQHLPKDALIHL
jgi:hypothetical protein